MTDYKIVKAIRNGEEYELPSPTSPTIDLLVVGGGGAGHSGGGGGGGFIEKCGYEVNIGNQYCVVVGAGGDADYSYTNNMYLFSNGNGGYSSFGDLIAVGGGGGGDYYRGGWGKGNLGGSGGGSYSGMCGRVSEGGKYVEGQGCNGGYSTSSGGGAAGGGGGAGNSGGNAVGTNYCSGGNGGDGRCSCISGDCVWYSGGGAGVGTSSASHSYGGCGGGGDSLYVSNANRGCNGTCCGAGGGGGTQYYIGTGACGIVVARYKTDGSMGINCATGGCVYCCDGYTIHCFTSDGTFCIVS